MSGSSDIDVVKEEHVLVCLSPSPTNKKIIYEAAKLARAFQARFTALYVAKSQENPPKDEDQKRLQNNIQYAEDMGAAITTVIGDDVSFQIAEFARISDVSKIVIGRSNISRYHFWERQTITDHLIAIAPNIDIYIIPDLKTNIKESNKKRFTEQIIPSLKELFITVGIMIVMTGLGLCFSLLGFTESNIITVYILGVLLSAIFTRSHLCSLISSLLSVLLFNFFFTEPQFTFHAYEPGYSATFVIMLIAALLTGSLAYRLKDNASESARVAYRTQILFDTNQLLQKSRSYDAVLQVIANQVNLLLSRDIIIYSVENNKTGKEYVYKKDTDDTNYIKPEKEEAEILQWVLDNKRRAGATTRIFPKSRFLYLAIGTNDKVYGIIGITIENKPLSSFEYSILLSILGECAMALENLDNERAKEEAAVIAQNEKLRANLLRTISHDLRTPLTSISGNASNLYSHYKMLDDETRERMFSDIYDDSEWLIRLVENLLSVTRIENGEMQLNKSLQVLDDVVGEALSHVDRNKSKHIIRVSKPDEILLANMDAKLIEQVIVNLVNNAIKYTQRGSEIEISYGNEKKAVYVRVADNGPGMDEDVKKHAFDMFYSGQNNIVDSKRGMGLGLALCKAVVEAHGGVIEIKDNIPSGCVFTFFLERENIML
ncbi:MAG: DUF4118 domain-containing protein [Lachnospiraceae bacterium]|nr:DUF4118 domain-containing protein [Lachnospiraceae bacterium]